MIVPIVTNCYEVTVPSGYDTESSELDQLPVLALRASVVRDLFKAIDPFACSHPTL